MEFTRAGWCLALLISFVADFQEGKLIVYYDGVLWECVGKAYNEIECDIHPGEGLDGGKIKDSLSNVI